MLGLSAACVSTRQPPPPLAPVELPIAGVAILAEPPEHDSVERHQPNVVMSFFNLELRHELTSELFPIHGRQATDGCERASASQAR